MDQQTSKMTETEKTLTIREKTQMGWTPHGTLMIFLFIYLFVLWKNKILQAGAKVGASLQFQKVRFIASSSWMACSTDDFTPQFNVQSG